MVQCKCIHKFRNQSGKIISYKLKDLNDNEIVIRSDNLKQAIQTKKISVVNLKLTSDDRLVDTAIDNLKNKTILNMLGVKEIRKMDTLISDEDNQLTADAKLLSSKMLCNEKLKYQNELQIAEFREFSKQGIFVAAIYIRLNTLANMLSGTVTITESTLDTEGNHRLLKATITNLPNPNQVVKFTLRFTKALELAQLKVEDIRTNRVELIKTQGLEHSIYNPINLDRISDLCSKFYTDYKQLKIK